MWAVSFFVILAASATFCMVNWIRKWWEPKCNGVLPPGSMGLPLIGETLEIITKSYSLDIHPFFKRRVARYGPIFRTSLVGRPVIVSADQEFNNYILQEEGRLVEIWYFDTLAKLFSMEGESRINRVGQLHKYVRGSFISQFGPLGLKTMTQELQLAMRTSLDKWSSQPSVDLVTAIPAMAFEFSAKRLFGGYHFAASPETMAQKINIIGQGLMAFPLNFPGTTYRNCLKEHGNFMDMLKGILMDRLSTHEDHHQGDLLSNFIDGIDNVEFMTEDIVLQLMFISIFASVESVSIMITLLLKLLSVNNRVVEELKAEHVSTVGKGGNGKSIISWEDYKSMAFTSQVINETLRLANLVPGLARRATQDIHVKGMTIPSGWTILLVSSTVHMNPDVFVDPLGFNPWRWKEFDSYAVSKNLMPFGGGIRQCVGADYTRIFLFIFIHELVTNYKWTKTKGGEVYRNPLLVFKDGMHFHFSKL